MKNLKLKATGVLLAMSLATGFSQTVSSNTRDIEIGVKGGVNFSNMYTKDVDQNDVLTSFNAGLYATIPLSERFSLQPEFIFSRKGSKLTYDNAIAQGSAKFKLNYVEVPLLLKANITKNFNIHFGPYVSYLIDAQVKNESSSGTYDFENNYSNEDFNKFDVGLSGGIGLDFDTMGFGLRYDYGLTTVGKERTVGGVTYTSPDGKNSSLSLYLSLKIN